MAHNLWRKVYVVTPNTIISNQQNIKWRVAWGSSRYLAQQCQSGEIKEFVENAVLNFVQNEKVRYLYISPSSIGTSITVAALSGIMGSNNARTLSLFLLCRLATSHQQNSPRWPTDVNKENSETRKTRDWVGTMKPAALLIPACESHLPYYIVICGLSGSTTFFDIIS